MKKKTVLDLTKKVLTGKTSMRLNDIVAGVRSSVKGTDSSRYIGVYHALREYPQFFERTGYGLYRMRSKELKSSTTDHETIKSVMVQVLGKKKMTSTQVWRGLQKEGIYPTFRAVSSYLIGDDRFDHDEASLTFGNAEG